MDDGDVLRVLHDARNRVGHVQNETGGELAFRLAGVDQTRRVRHKFSIEHDFGHRIVKVIALDRIGFGFRNVTDDAADDIGPGFERVAVQILS